MALWKWKEQFVDERECAVEAETEEEAREKIQSGEWVYEDTVNFYSNQILRELSGPHADEDDA